MNYPQNLEQLDAWAKQHKQNWSEELVSIKAGDLQALCLELYEARKRLETLDRELDQEWSEVVAKDDNCTWLNNPRQAVSA